jgi:hypothetical protein
MRVRTDLYSGENGETKLTTPVDALNAAVELYQSANYVAENALVDPNALKIWMNYLPPANEP